MTGKTTRLTESKCPYCREKLDCTTGLGDYDPKPGDVTLCAYCAAVMVFGEDLTPRRPTTQEMVDAARIPEVAKVRRAIFEVRSRAMFEKRNEQ